MKRYFISLPIVIGLALLLLATAGSLRYGSPGGLVMRVQAEISGRQSNPHPAFVPTPLPVAVVRTPIRVALSTPTPTPKPIRPTSTPTPAAKATGRARPSPSPSLSPTPLPSPTSTATPAHQSPLPDVALQGFRHAWQTWNNCGPATLAMQLSFFGSPLNQDDIRKALRPHPDDKNVNLDELAAYARDQGYEAVVMHNGDEETLRMLLSNGLPVLVETWLEEQPNDGMGHYRLLTGYDDAAQEWIAYDAYVSGGVKKGQPYQGIRLPYAKTAALWKVFNRPYLLVYEQTQTPLVTSMLDDFGDDGGMWQHSEARARAEIDANPADAFAWFNLGSSLVALAQYEEAAAAYDQARVLGLPWRMLWYQFGPFQAYVEMGRFQEVVALADATVRTTDTVEELHYWRGRGLAGLGDGQAAQAAFRRAVELNPNYRPAADALAVLGASS